ncbi:NUDIX domain-containing protein [Amycolatopsis sp. NPDC058986]|uniref:NUDIX domain-containing protein n=1 Tax=unclassified Amycolatopsis TaxID=2618356 RepID=UPI00366BD9D3
MTSKLMRSPGNAPGPRVATYALIGRDQELLIHDDGDNGCSLPGTAVQDGDPVEAALHRALAEKLHAVPIAVDFCTVVEHDITPEGYGPASEIAFLFDVTLDEQHAGQSSWPGHFHWDNENFLVRLQPLAVRKLWRQGLLSIATPWHAWAPRA